jgi:hypothetical protein
MSENAHAFKIQEAHRTSIGIAMRSFIDKKQSLQCQVEMAEVTEHFRETSSMPLKHVVESEEGPNCHLEPQITEEAEEDKEKMEDIMFDEKNIAQIIKSREDLTASGIDRISYGIMKRARAE